MSKFVNELLEDLKKTSKYLKEDYIFNDGEAPMEPGMEGEAPQEPGAPVADPTVPQQQAQAAQQGDNAEEQAMHAQEVIKHEPIIGKIRETAIEGLKKYSDNPTSKLYEFFKKVFLESDKVLTDTGSKN
jgi:hypothetical protein